MNEGLAAKPGISGHVLEFQTRAEIHPEEGCVAAGGNGSPIKIESAAQG
jgi:hypothetical protein